MTNQATTDGEGSSVGLTVWYGKMPESNGRENWTATLRRVNPTDKWDMGFCFARSEYPGRVLYEADRMRWIIGERKERPDILAYDADAHSGYVEPAPRGEGTEAVAWLIPGVEHDMVFSDPRVAEEARGRGFEVIPLGPLAHPSGAEAPSVVGAREWIEESPCRPGCASWNPHPHRKTVCDCGRDEALAALSSAQDGSRPQAVVPTEGHDAAVVEHMVQRFLSWRLPENFNPDNGISFKPTFNDHMDPPMRCNPTGTNLFDARQAEAMVRHLLEGLPK